jgi:glycine/D-amino acid oxidase-like deaminating enzyme
MTLASYLTGRPLPAAADAVIIGAGIQGCAAAYYLAKRGMKPVLLDKSAVAGQQSGRAWGFVRIMDREEPEVPLMIEAMKIWPGLEAELGSDLEWRQEGNLFLAGSDAELAHYEDWLKIARKYGLDTQVLGAKEVAKLMPGLTDPGKGGLYGPTEGQAEPRKAAAAFARRAAELGALIFEGCGAIGLETAGGAVSSVVTEAGAIRTKIAVVSAGASSFRILKTLGLDLPQQHVRATCSRTNAIAPVSGIAFFGHHMGFRQRRDGSLNLADESALDVDLTLGRLRALKWFLPAWIRSREPMSVALNAATYEDLLHRLPWRPEARQPWIHDRAPNIPANQARVRASIEKLRRYFPASGDARIVESWAGNVDVLPDAIPVIGPAPRPVGLILATGYSGHGFAMGPISGRLIAEIAADGRPSLDLKAFRFERYAEGAVKLPQQVR